MENRFLQIFSVFGGGAPPLHSFLRFCSPSPYPSVGSWDRVWELCVPIFTNYSLIFKTGPILGRSSVLRPVCESVCEYLTHFPNAPASAEEDEEKVIYGSSRGEGQFISDL